MAIHYLVNGKKYSMSYQQLKAEYQDICELNPSEFSGRLPKILHVACVICYLKEVRSEVCLSDEGIIHRLAHLLDIGGTNEEVGEIMVLFQDQCRLV